MELKWDYEELTRKHAALLCWKMWEWLAGYITQEMIDEKKGYEISNGIFKEDWPEYKRNGGTVSGLKADCAACQYVNTFPGPHDKVKCFTRCFLILLWPESCMEGHSPYNLFGEAETAEEAARHANTIAIAAKAVYDEEEK